MNPLHVQLLMLMFAGWVSRSQQNVIDYLQAENRVLREQLDDLIEGVRWVPPSTCETSSGV